MKRLIALACLVLSLTGCSKDNNTCSTPHYNATTVCPCGCTCPKL
jgi:PBP1b-binding outer membrane lipoprotein LpoB